MTRPVLRHAAAAVWALACLGLWAGEASAQLMPMTTDDEARHELHVYRRNSALLGAFTITSIVVNSAALGNRQPPAWMGALGFLTGTLQIVLGTRDTTSHPQTSAGNLFIGGATVLTSLSALARGAPEEAHSLESGPQLRPLLGMDSRLEPRAGAALSF